jgi:hypothetical protein
LIAVKRWQMNQFGNPKNLGATKHHPYSPCRWRVPWRRLEECVMPRRSTAKGQGQPASTRRRAREPDAFDTAFVDALSADFVQYGSAALARLREDDPVSYMKLCAAVLPKAVAGAIDPLEAMTDEELLDRAKGRTVTVCMEEARIFAIRNNLPAIFKVSPSRRGSGAAPFHRKHNIGAEAVRKHDEAIVRESARFGVDPDLVRAIMYIENADGDRAGLDRAKQFIGQANTLLPMNINPIIWDGVGGVRGEQFKNPELNIRAGVALIKAIQDRIDKPTPAKIGSVWQFAGKENVSDNGNKIERAMLEQLWITGSPSDGDPAPRGP